MMKFLDTEVFRERSVISLPNTLMFSKLFLRRDLKLVLFVCQLLGRVVMARKQLQRPQRHVTVVRENLLTKTGTEG